MIPARRFAAGTALFFVLIFLADVVFGDSVGRALLHAALATVLWSIFMYFWGTKPARRHDG
jgi:hypothetical protein